MQSCLRCFCFCCAWVCTVSASVVLEFPKFHRAGCTAEGGRGDDAHDACFDLAPNPADVHDARFSGGWLRISLGFRAQAQARSVHQQELDTHLAPTPAPKKEGTHPYQAPHPPSSPGSQGPGQGPRPQAAWGPRSPRPAPAPGGAKFVQNFCKISAFFLQNFRKIFATTLIFAKKLQKSVFLFAEILQKNCRNLAEFLQKFCKNFAPPGLATPVCTDHGTTNPDCTNFVKPLPHHAPPPSHPPPPRNPAQPSGPNSQSFQLPFRLQHTVKTPSTNGLGLGFRVNRYNRKPSHTPSGKSLCAETFEQC